MIHRNDRHTLEMCFDQTVRQSFGLLQSGLAAPCFGIRLFRVAVCCNILQYVVVTQWTRHPSAQHTAAHCNTLQHVQRTPCQKAPLAAPARNIFQQTASHCKAHCNTHFNTHSNTLQHILQHTLQHIPCQAAPSSLRPSAN